MFSREDRHGEVQVGPGAGGGGDGAQLPAHVRGAVHALRFDPHSQRRVCFQCTFFKLKTPEKALIGTSPT